MASGLVYLASSQYQFRDREGLTCSMSAGTAATWIKSPIDGRKHDCSSISFRCRSPFLRSLQSCPLANGQDLSLSKVRVAADYSDSLPDSTKYAGSHGYHPLEEVKDRAKKKDTLLTNAEIARTTVEANGKGLLVFPGRVHCEPHGHVAWAEFHYVIDDYGDIFFELLDDENILQDPGASNPVKVLIGMDGRIYGEDRITTSDLNDYMDDEDDDDDGMLDLTLDDDYDEIDDTEVTDILIKWGMPETLRSIHPIYFANCLTKAIHAKHGKKMDCPSNGISIVGCLRPAFIEEESYLRRLFHMDDDGYISDRRDEFEKEEDLVAGSYELIDGETLRFMSKDDRSNMSSTYYKLEIMTIELLSVYGNKSMVNLQDFQDAEPDILAQSASSIIEHINEYGTQCTTALKALCRRRKGLNVEGANLIGVDSRGMDVRVFSGLEAQTLRFSFNSRCHDGMIEVPRNRGDIGAICGLAVALSESAAEKKIKRMLFPRYHRKNCKDPNVGVREL